MKLGRLLEKRSYLISFITSIFIIFGVLLIYVTPNIIYSQNLTIIEDNLKEYADDYQTTTSVNEGYNLYEHDNGVSTLLTRSGYIVNMNPDLDRHLIMWGFLQESPTQYYNDDFEGDNYVYYIKVLGDEHYIVTFVGTAEVHNFINLFRLYSIGLVLVLYIISIILGSTVLSGKLIKKISFLNTRTNFQNKLSLVSYFKKKSLSSYNFAYLNVHNFDDIIDSCGVSFTDVIVDIIGDRLRTLFRNNQIFEIRNNEYIIVSKEEIDIVEIMRVFEDEMQGHSNISTYQLRVKVVTVDTDIMSSESIQTIIKRLEYGYSLIKAKQDSSINIGIEIVKEMNNQTYYQSNLEQALKNEQLVNYYQPKVDPHTNKIVGCEALSRWVDNGKIISPTKYINIAEANGLIYTIDVLSFKNSCRMVKKLSDLNMLDEGFKISTNLSPITLINLDFKVLKQIMNEYEVNPKNISVEITESVVIDFKKVSGILRDISKGNITIEIDDFSAGNSSFTVLPVLNADYLKLDMAILPVDIGEYNKTMIYESLVGISKKLGFKIIAEGVETNIQAKYVTKTGVDLIQGYYYSQPLADEEFIEFMKNFKIKTLI